MAKQYARMGEVAAGAGISRETIRFYQRIGLIGDSHRTPRGYRQFTPEDSKRIAFIRRAKELGFSLSEVRELLEIADGRGGRCSEVQEVAEHVLGTIDSRLTQLRRLRQALGALVHKCRTTESVQCCPIIEELTRAN